MCDSTSLSILSTVVDDFVRQDKLFTAFEVTLEAKKKGLQLRHRDVKADIHDLVKPYVQQGLYQQELRNVGAPEKALLYFPDGADPDSYKPLARGGGQNQRFDILSGMGTAPQPTVTPVPQSSPTSRAHEPDSRGRICVPASLLRSAGLHPGDVAHVAVDNNRVVISATAMKDLIACYKVDKDNNLRLSASIAEKANLTNKDYEFTGDSQRVIVSPAV